jgi:pilus assembly protein CpaE
VQRLHDRLHVLAAEEDLTSMPDCAPGAAERLLETLQRRYSYIVLDVPFRAGLLNRRLLELAHQRVLVAEPGLAACRDTLRLLSLPPGPMQTRPGLVVLNRMGRAGGLSRAQAEQALGFAPAVVVPDLPRGVGEAATLGAPAATRNRAFRAAIAAIAQQALGVGAPRPRRWFGWRR